MPHSHLPGSFRPGEGKGGKEGGKGGKHRKQTHGEGPVLLRLVGEWQEDFICLHVLSQYQVLEKCLPRQEELLNVLYYPTWQCFGFMSLGFFFLVFSLTPEVAVNLELSSHEPLLVHCPVLLDVLCVPCGT